MSGCESVFLEGVCLKVFYISFHTYKWLDFRVVTVWCVECVCWCRCVSQCLYICECVQCLGVSLEGTRPFEGVRASLPTPCSPTWVQAQACGFRCPFNAPPTPGTT